MLFLGGVVTGILISVVVAVIIIVTWKKFIKKKIDDALFKASLKAIEKEKDK